MPEANGQAPIDNHIKVLKYFEDVNLLSIG